jgi:hypothetical protein
MEAVTPEENLRRALPFSSSKPVICIDDGITYPSIRAAERAYDLWDKAVNKVLRGIQKTAGGKRFAYAA